MTWADAELWRALWPPSSGSVSSERGDRSQPNWSFQGEREGTDEGAEPFPPKAGSGGGNWGCLVGCFSRKELANTRCVFKTKQTHVCHEEPTRSTWGSVSQPVSGHCHLRTATGRVTPGGDGVNQAADCVFCELVLPSPQREKPRARQRAPSDSPVLTAESGKNTARLQG